MRRLRFGPVLLLLALAATSPLAAQPAVDPNLEEDVVTGIGLLNSELGLLLAGGNPVLGTASPLGTKFRWMPRFNIGGRIGFGWVDVPDIISYPADPTAPVGRIDVNAVLPQLDISVGVFDGFDLGSTLGGFGALEVLGSLGSVVLSADDGFQNDATGAGLGVRAGLLRESFTFPGVSISASYKWFGRVQLGSVERGSDAQYGFDMAAWSVRAGISKSFVAIGLALTLAYDHFETDYDWGLAGAPGELVPVVPEGSPVNLDGESWSAFVDVSYIVLFFNIVGEVGWQEEVRRTNSRGDELTAGGLLGALGIRFTL
ncbi:MAG: hypothetical protein GWN99_04375 [Gemmatimonadetes bacterium]|uniref:MipA/OmpV family protein n=1 Tax=Candidatus Kutchimonas denitrificans TaxID=3056748 RepID=A0AAE4Z9T2_9BACT|nr:hypothetical protein [Gemmatimonadota bacterium]NIR75688.1 hypothetical protein [Candidatus Kutchimonas denitrificans]NIS00301.1 hypothetical protein [Gemmatimonadota bacterium]NIT65960.1 hypothetical protein [Gemmatimonadota bacterium]NIU53664.1 hypothetical protein [Gemmatimonadota bacterium]